MGEEKITPVFYVKSDKVSIRYTVALFCVLPSLKSTQPVIGHTWPGVRKSPSYKSIKRFYFTKVIVGTHAYCGSVLLDDHSLVDREKKEEKY